MIGKVAARREARVDQIVAAAWDLADSVGIAEVTLRALADAVGMRQPSLYEYFDSKHALYDAMFADGNRALLEHLDGVDVSGSPRRAVKRLVGAFVDFVLAKEARATLLFQRPVPGFAPSPESFAYAEEVFGRVVALLHAAGMQDAGDIDCFVAMVGGVITATTANDPEGDRYTRHLDRLIDLHLDNAKKGKRP